MADPVLNEYTVTLRGNATWLNTEFDVYFLAVSQASAETKALAGCNSTWMPGAVVVRSSLGWPEGVHE